MFAAIEKIPLLALSVFFHPLTSFAERANGYLSTSKTSKWAVEPVPLNPNRSLFCDVKYHAPLNVTLWSPRNQPDITVFRSTSQDGWNHGVRKLVQETKSEGISVRSTGPWEVYGVQELQYHKAGSYEPSRILQWLEDENGYRLLDEGVPFPFEDLKIRPQDRIANRAALLQFVKHFGIDFGDEAFWHSDFDAFYITETWMPKHIVDSEMNNLVRKMGGRIILPPG